MDQIEPGGTITLPAGEISSMVLRVPNVTVSCDKNTVIDAEGQGHAVEILAAGISFSDCQIRNWGQDLTKLDAGIFVSRQATGSVIHNNRLTGPAFGIWVDATADVVVRNNYIQGDAGIRSQDRGNGIHLFNTSGALIEENKIIQTRDGIYIEAANNNTIRNNLMTSLRYGIHYMYSMDNLLENNITRNTRTGYALMQSKRLRVIGNRSENDENYGILLNFITDSIFLNNVVEGVSQGQTAGLDISGAEGKGLFVYNSLYNRFESNFFVDNNIGIHLTAGSEDNKFKNNAFINNTNQVKYVSNRLQEWSTDGVGNYWSDYLGWDLNKDDIGDTAYEPNDGIDRLLWKYPDAKLLINSPSVMLLRWVQKQFPILKSPGVKDSHPLMTLPAELTP
ncbi:nitrous oxide reductase family maturation protein NosD [Methylophaga nitratireducenticrescens]|uniref:nitrous oxide reductase family maturation protein NosD n=1 Tax=Methylophaga nitratireducenticrescens TaxID=754476 RepID=UPI001930EDF8|nr:nitrous oxide reductase family maturation protein NosD [Methylophaga nitratireducenticrescens]